MGSGSAPARPILPQTMKTATAVLVLFLILAYVLSLRGDDPEAAAPREEVQATQPTVEPSALLERSSRGGSN